MAEQLAKLLEELKKEKDSFKGMGIDYEEKAFYDILKAVAKKYEFEYPDDKMIELSKRIKIIVDDKAKYTDWSTRDDIMPYRNILCQRYPKLSSPHQILQHSQKL